MYLAVSTYHYGLLECFTQTDAYLTSQTPYRWDNALLLLANALLFENALLLFENTLLLLVEDILLLFKNT